MSRRPRRLLVIAIAIAIAVAAAVFIAAELTDFTTGSPPSATQLLSRFGVWAGFVLIYFEESGIPLFIPGDVFLVYVGHQLPPAWWVRIAAWLGFIAAVVLGSTNLYLLSRRFGSRVLQLPAFKRVVHVSPERVARAERAFARWGVWALIVGRHIPGLRVPLTVAAGTLRMPYPRFAASVAVSSAIWAAIFLSAGVVYGDTAADLLRSRWLYVGLAAAVLVAAVLIAVRFWITPRVRAMRAREYTPDP